MDDAALQEDEVLALSAIYGEAALKKDESQESTYNFALSLDADPDVANASHLTSARIIRISFTLPSNYPSTHPPIYHISSVYCGSMKLTDDVRQEIDQHFGNLFVPGNVVLFEWIEWLRQYLIERVPESHAPEVEQEVRGKRAQDGEDTQVDNGHEVAQPAPPKSNLKCPEIISSTEPIVDRKSVFVAHVARVTSQEQVNIVIETLYQNKKIAKATHNIRAWRFRTSTGGIHQDNDDDGETAAGGRLLHLLQILEVENVLVVVTRWYGGILLGADRFKHINNCARSLLAEAGFIKGGH